MPPALPRIAIRRGVGARERGQHHHAVPVVAGQVAPRPPERVHRLALVQLHRPAAVLAFDDPHVLLDRLPLVEDAVVPLLDLAGRDRQRQGERGGDRERAAADGEERDQPERQREGDEGPLRAEQRDRDQRRGHRADQRARGGDRVEAADRLARAARVVPHRQPRRPGRDRAEQRHRHRDQDQDPEERAGEGGEREPLEGLDREAEEGARGEGDDGDQRRGEQDAGRRPSRIGVAIGDPAAEPVAGREGDEHDRDRVRPDDRRGAEVGREQARGGDLDAEAGGADDEDERAEGRGSRHRAPPGRPAGPWRAPWPAPWCRRPSRHRFPIALASRRICCSRRPPWPAATARCARSGSSSTPYVNARSISMGRSSSGMKTPLRWATGTR